MTPWMGAEKTLDGDEKGFTHFVLLRTLKAESRFRAIGRRPAGIFVESLMRRTRGRRQ